MSLIPYYFILKSQLYLLTIFRKTVLSLRPPFANLKKYLEDRIERLKLENLTIYWKTPREMRINYTIIEMKTKKIKLLYMV